MVFEDKSLAPYRGREPFIFISYSHRNSDQAAEIISCLNRAGFRVWYDEGLIPGREWDENIARIIMGCSFFIALLTKEYLASSNCKDELNYARDKNKSMELVYLEEVSLPAGMELRLGRQFAVHRNQYPNEEAFYAKVFSADGIARCNRRYNPKTASDSSAAPVRTAKPDTRRTEIEPIEDFSSGNGLRVFGVVLLLLILVGTVFFLYRSYGTGHEVSPGPSYPIQTVVPTDPSHEADLDIESAPEPDPEPSVVLEDWEDTTDEMPGNTEEEMFVIPDMTDETISLPEPDPTPAPEPDPTPEPEPVSEPVPDTENTVFTDTEDTLSVMESSEEDME